MNVYLPTQLKAQMEGLDLPWSQISAQAFVDAIREQQERVRAIMERLSVAASLELQQLIAGSELVTPEQVVEIARDEASALHRYFEWDDSVAAEEYRIVQARRVLRLCVTVVSANSPPLRALVSLSSDRAAHGGYRPLSIVMADPEQRAVLLQDALEALQGFQAKYTRLVELAELWPVAEKITRRHRKGRR